MAQFTFIELHFEEGAIPQPNVLGSGKQETGETDNDTGEAQTGGSGIARAIFMLFVFAIAIWLARKLQERDDLGQEEL